eukprot:15457706-Alexandrium_andersonii.AAC.1
MQGRGAQLLVNAASELSALRRQGTEASSAQPRVLPASGSETGAHRSPLRAAALPLDTPRAAMVAHHKCEHAVARHCERLVDIESGAPSRSRGFEQSDTLA